jgi:transcriptional regulator with XRE-family HTH domain
VNDNLYFKHHLGEVLRKLRFEQGLKLTALSSIAYISVAHISDIERGKKSASLDVIEALARGLDTPLSTILHSVAEQVESEEQMYARNKQLTTV